MTRKFIKRRKSSRGTADRAASPAELLRRAGAIEETGKIGALMIFSPGLPPEAAQWSGMIDAIAFSPVTLTNAGASSERGQGNRDRGRRR